MKVTFLGTNGWYDTPTGNTPCVFVETENEYIIFDAGFGFYKARHLVTSGKPVFLFLSHLHLDHLIGLHTLPLFKLPQGIDLFVPKGMGKTLKNFLRRPLTSSLMLLPTKIRIREITPKTQLPFAFEMKPLRHSVPCYGYRLELGGGTISYCTDTGLCANLKRLARAADLLITECAMKPGDTAPNIFHITPETAAGVAVSAGVKKLALFHFDPAKYPAPEHRKEAEKAARKAFVDSIAANDGTEIII